MNTKEMAYDHLSWASGSLGEAKEALARGDYPRTVRRAQECIELAAKAVLRALGIEFPREHDVSDVLRELGGDLPSWFQEVLPQIAESLHRITPKRGPAMYGFERELRPSRGAFTQEDGAAALRDAEFVYEQCERFFREWFGEL